MLLADYALNVTLVSLFIWVVLFPVLVQGLIVYAVVLAKGEKRDNEMAKRHRE
jgi:phage shock protein PspC (stress-responsive transcriptional regulator)